MTERHCVLIIDDEPDIRELLEITLIRMGLDTQSAENISDAKQFLSEQEYQLVLTDMNLPDGNGIDLVKFVQSNFPTIPIAMITAYGSVETAINALKAGAFDFLSKPVDLGQLRDLVASALKLNQDSHSAETKATTNDLASDMVKHQIPGRSKVIEKLNKQVIKLARSQAPLYISGESGSGKELAARMIHAQGPRKDAPFIPVNCGAIPTELMESEFFGHLKGSFSGAHENKEGLFKAAHGGTLFLDEVADLPLSMQVKLLRAIQEKAVRPVGGSQEERIDVRVLSATHKDLEELVKEGEFRQDLFYRINVIKLDIPSLRERPEDIELLAEHFLQKTCVDCGEGETILLSNDAMQALKRYRFPGNVRELENIIERAYTLCEDNTIQVDDLRLELNDESNETDSNFRSNDETQESVVKREKTNEVSDDSKGVALNHPTVKETNSPTSGAAGRGDLSLEDYLESIERAEIEQALQETKWNRTAAAKKLGISFRALRYRLKKLGMD